MLENDAGGLGLKTLSQYLEAVPDKYNFKMEKGFRVTVGSNWKQKPQCYESFHLFYLRDGSGKYYLEGKEYDLLPGRVIFMTNGVTHWTSHDPGNPPKITTSFFRMQDNATGENIVFDKPFYLSLEDKRMRELPEGFDSLYDHFTSGKDGFSENYCSILLARIMYEVYSIASKRTDVGGGQDPRVTKVIHYINDNPEIRLETAELASMVGMTGDYFSRLFKKNTGVSLKHFQVSVRLRYARYLLEHTESRISEVAYKLNYADAYIFSKQFKEFFGASPKELKTGKLAGK